MRRISLLTLSFLCLGLSNAGATERRQPHRPQPARPAASSTATAGAVAGASAASTASVTAQGGASAVVIRDALQAPSLGGIANYPTAECLRTYGVGGSGPGASGLLSISLADEHCRVLARAAMLDRLGHRAAAKEALCDRSEFREVFKRTGEPCAADRPQQPVTAARPMEEVFAGQLGLQDRWQQPAQPPQAAMAAPRPRPAYCRPEIANDECR